MTSDYYNERQRTDERLTAALLEIQGRLRDGETFAKQGRTRKGICVTRTLEAHKVTSRWSAFVMQFDFSKSITSTRVARERETFSKRDLIRWVLAHPEQARQRYNIAPPKPAPKPKPQPKPVEIPTITLEDWGFTDRMSSLWLRWMVMDETRQDAREPFLTHHAIRPQSYKIVSMHTPNGTPYKRRVRLGGSFRNGMLTAKEADRVLTEGRQQVSEAFPGKVLQSEASMRKMWDYLNRW